MALVSMKSDEASDGCMPCGPNPYGYGMELRMDESQCKALGIMSPIPAGTKITISALAFVKSSSESVEDDGDSNENDVSMCLQITDMEIAPAKAGTKSSAAVLYGSKD